MNVDEIDLKILNILKENSKLSFKDIGEKIHLTGQAVGARVNKLVDDGIIENFTININKENLGITNTAFIKIYMTTYDHSKIKAIINDYEEIVEAFRISADGCYLLKVESSDKDFLNSLLDKITEFANYQLSLSVSKIK